MKADFDAGNFKVRNVADGVIALDAVNKSQLDKTQQELTESITALSDRFQVVEELPETKDENTFYFIPEKD